MEAMLQVRNLTKRFGKEKVLDGVTLEVYRGEFLTVLGPSGVGKTTLLRIIVGLERPDEGEVIIDGVLVSGREVFIPPAKRKVGIVFQEPSLFPHMTVFENIAFGLRELKNRERKERVFNMLFLVGLENKANRYPSELSGGEYQRVCLARALAPYPRLLLLDEPFANLDRALREELREEVREITKSRDITTILVTHDQEEAMEISDRIAILGPGGKIYQIGTPQELYFKPKDLYVANFFGKINIFEGKVQNGRFFSLYGSLNSHDLRDLEEKRVAYVVRPENLVLVPDQQGLLTIKEVRFLKHEVMIILKGSEGATFYALCRASDDRVYEIGLKVNIILEKSKGTFLPLN